ncbi:hypothetical protein Tco_1021030 [Tanacetum coccineum]
MLLEDTQLVFKSKTLVVCLCQRRRHQQRLKEAKGLNYCLKPLYLRKLSWKRLPKEANEKHKFIKQVAQGDSDDDNDDDDQQSNNERTESDDDKAADPNKTDDEEEDEFIHTPNDYVPIDDENLDDEEYDRIHKEMYDDVNTELKDAGLANEEKGDEEMSYAERVDAEHEEVSQEVAGDQVNDDAQGTVTAVLAT